MKKLLSTPISILAATEYLYGSALSQIESYKYVEAQAMQMWREEKERINKIVEKIKEIRKDK